MRKLIYIFYALFLMSCVSNIRSNSGGMQLNRMFPLEYLVYSGGYGFSVNIPRGWFFDKYAAEKLSLPAVFIPEGYIFFNAPAVMYANCFNKAFERNSNLANFIRLDYERFKNRNPSIQINDLGSVSTEENKEAVLKSFIDPDGGQQAKEAVAYIDDELIIAVIVLSTAHQQYFEMYLPLFKEVVSSYAFYGEFRNGPTLQELEDLHQQSISAPGGQEYERNAIRSFFADSGYMRECAPPDAPIAEPFTIYFQVLTNGRMGEIWFFPETPVATCMKRHVINRMFPIPERPFVVMIRLGFTK